MGNSDALGTISWKWSWMQSLRSTERFFQKDREGVLFWIASGHAKDDLLDLLHDGVPWKYLTLLCVF